MFGPVDYIVHINDLETRLPLYKYVDGSTEWEVCSTSVVAPHVKPRGLSPDSGALPGATSAVDSQIQQTATATVEW